MRRRRGLLAVILAAGFCGSAEQIQGQISPQRQIFPSAGYPRRTNEPIPNTAVGPSSGLASPRVSTLRGRVSESATGSGLLATPWTTPRPLTASPSLYASPRPAISNVQQEAGQPGSATAASPNVPRSGSTLSSGLSADFGLSGSGLGLDVLAAYRERGRRMTHAPPLDTSPSTSLTAAPAEPAAEAAAAPAEPDEPFANDLGVPFEQFESYEEFRAWLTDQLAQPGGGAVGQALARLEAMDAPPAAAPVDQYRTLEQDRTRETSWADRPPVGYVGVGSEARMPIGSFQFGADTAYESSRLAAELTQYLQSRRVRPRRQASTAVTSPGQPTAPGALPPPRSNLGLRLERQRLSRSAGPTAGRMQGFAPAVEPRQYYQNLGGYTPPQPALDWLPPGAGY